MHSGATVSEGKNVTLETSDEHFRRGTDAVEPMEGVTVFLGVVSVDTVSGEGNDAVTLLFVIGNEGESTEAQLVLVCSDGDSSVGMNLALNWLHDKPVPIDPIRDVLETAAIVRAARRNGVVEVGGGSPKNFYLQTQPTLWQMLEDSMGGHDYFVQITTDSPQWGGLSGATPSEARSWGKVKDARRNNVVVYSCASIALPILASYVLGTRKPRKPRELNLTKDDSLERLRRRYLRKKAGHRRSRRSGRIA